MKLYTIGFTQKTAEQFFGLLRENQIARLVDIRLRPDGQLAGFARRVDLPYFLWELADACSYIHMPELAPTDAILDEYRKSKDWKQFFSRFAQLLDERNIPATLDRAGFEAASNVLLCSEASPEHCHRRVVAERLASAWPGVEIIHL